MAEDLRARIAEVLNTTPAGFVQAEPDGPIDHARHAWHRHDRHRYNATCALCRGEEDTLADAVMAVVQPELHRLRAENTVLHQALRDHEFCAICGHERYQHQKDVVIRAVFCTACKTTSDLHDFTPTTKE